MNGITSSVSEILATLISGIMIGYIGLKRTLSLSYMIAFAGMLCLLMVNTGDQMKLSIFILGSKFGVSQVFNVAYLGNI